MSAWVVDKVHVDALVSAALQLAQQSDIEGDRFSWYYDGSRPELTPHDVEGLNRIGQVLVNECVRSVEDRYPDVGPGRLPGPVDEYAYYDLRAYEFAALGFDLSLPEIAKAVSCYEYQSCEHDEWEASEAHAFCAALKESVLRQMPDYDAAPWGIGPEWVARRITGVCPFCGADVALRKGGLVREHKTPGGINVRGVCPGSGKPAVGDQWVKVSVQVTVAATEQRQDPVADAEQLVHDLLGPHVKSITDWDNRFVIITAYEAAAERIAEPADAYST